ncbi:Uncharacterised protein [Xylophilus ampelinus]|nr:Uncharacterised protein [Xylophilus ampelinus]
MNPVAQASAQPTPVLATALPDARPAGSTRLRVWGLDIYDASLWVAPGFRADAWAQGRFALELHYLRGFDGEDIARRSLDEMRRQGPVSDAQAQAWLAAMRAAFPDVKKGDRLTGVHEPGVGARFFHNGEPRPAVRDPVFAQRFFAIWLDARTSEPALREALLAPAR